MARQAGGVPARTFKPGDVIFRRGEPANGEVYLVHKGTVEVRRTVDGEERILRTLGPGELLGEVALFPPGDRAYSAARSHGRT
jgi:CRP/FNR family cyclic AMP-dependent transcriptional regulator